MKISILIGFIFILFSTPVVAGELAERLDAFPQWLNKPTVEVARGELIYPDWMEGVWDVTSILTDQIAPLAPNFVTPGFEQNQRYLNQPIQFQVKFFPDYLLTVNNTSLIPSIIPKQLPIVPDRSFNGLHIAQAYLGEDQVTQVKVNPKNPNEQITILPNQGQLITKVTGRLTETVSPSRFIATEIAQQIFRGQGQIYLNEVETTTEYLLIKPGEIEGNQVTAIYLSAQDPNYFATGNQPVALYHYRLKIKKR